MNTEIISIRVGKKIKKELQLESTAYHRGKVGSYVLHLLENHPTRSTNRSIAKSRGKKQPTTP